MKMDTNLIVNTAIAFLIALVAIELIKAMFLDETTRKIREKGGDGE